jgi:hypothetical protein
MKRLNLFDLALMAVLVVGVMMTGAASSAASVPLPQIAAALGEAYPLNLGGSLTSGSLLRSEAGAQTAKEFSVLLSAAEPTSLGSAAIEYLGLEEPTSKHKCFTPGDSEVNGAVLLLNPEYHLIFFNFAPLERGALVSFTKLFELCNKGGIELTITAPATARLTVDVGGAEGDVTSM